jgi:RimJ/RimL family protein N-acetyltransferase
MKNVSLRPWAPGDRALLQRLLGEPGTTRNLGGPEAPEAVRARHERYLIADPEKHGLFAIIAGPDAEPVGWVGYWESEWHGEAVWECGWNVVPEAQGRGVATEAAALMAADARRRGTHRYLVAFPSVDNVASNALCRRLGFELLGEEDVEYPKGSMMRTNAWRLDLSQPRRVDPPAAAAHDPRRESTGGEWREEAREEALARAPESGRRFFDEVFARFPAVAGAVTFLRWSTQPDDVYAVVWLGGRGFSVQIDPALEYLIV